MAEKVPLLGSIDTELPFVAGVIESDTFFVPCFNTLLLGNEVELVVFFRLTADRIFFPDSTSNVVTSNYIDLDVSNTLILSSITGNNSTLFIRQYLNFSERIFGDPLGNGLSLVSFAGVVTTETAINTFNFNDHGPVELGAVRRAYLCSNSVNATEVLNALFREDADNTLTLDEVASSSASTYGRAPTQSVIQQHLTYRIVGDTCPLKEYSPLIGSSDDSTFDEMTTTPPTLTSGTLTLTYPRVAPTTTLVLKNPVYGNTDDIQFTRIDKETRGGKRILFSDPKWEERQTFQLSLVNVCSNTEDEIVDFLNESLGAEIGLLDWEGRNWKGFLPAPKITISQTFGGFSIQIIFEGQLV